MILCPARAELLDERQGWGDHPNATTIQLTPLGEEAVRAARRPLADAARPPRRSRRWSLRPRATRCSSNRWWR